MDPKLFEQQLRELAEIKHSEETGGWVIKKLKPCKYHCDRCDQMVDSTQCNSTLIDRIIKHWRHHCKGCSNYLDPRTHRPLGGQLSSAANTIISIVRNQRFLEGKINFRPTKKRKMPDTIPVEQTPAEQIEDNQSIIRRWDREEAK